MVHARLLDRLARNIKDCRLADQCLLAVSSLFVPAGHCIIGFPKILVVQKLKFASGCENRLRTPYPFGRSDPQRDLTHEVEFTACPRSNDDCFDVLPGARMAKRFEISNGPGKILGWFRERTERKPTLRGSNSRPWRY